MSKRADVLKLVSLIRRNILGCRRQIKLISSWVTEIDAQLELLSAIESAEASMDRERLYQRRQSIEDQKLDLEFSLKEAGRALLHHGKEISDALDPTDLLGALGVSVSDRALLETSSGQLLHMVFAYGLENSDLVRGRDFIDPDLQPLTWQFNLAMVDWMWQTDAGHRVSNEVWEQTFGPVPDGWKQPVTILQKCGVPS